MQIQAFCKQRPYVDKGRMSLLTKTFLVMKLSAVLILVASLHVAARSTAQKVTYSGKDVDLPTVLSVIREQTGYVFFYDKKDLKDIEPISVSLKDVPVEDALRSILLGLPLEFELQGNTVFITRKTVSRRGDAIEGPAPEPAPLDTIRGYVRDSTGAPLQGASVTIKGTKDGSKTDMKGEFGLIRAKAGMVVVISYTGYNNKEVVITSGTHSLFNVYLQRSQSALDATVVQAYGTTSRRYDVGSISTVDAATIEKQPVTNVLLALEGQVPGLAINATTGVPGSQVLIQVRGQNTVTSNTATPGNLIGQKPYDQPLFIIDGVPFAPQNNNLSQLNNLASGSNFSGGISQLGGISPFDNINPNDIESISVLKDADATSIYGTQGSNGVILITTKKGKPGKTVFNLMATTGYNTAARTVKLLNTPQYLKLRTDAFAADGVAPSNDPYNYDAYAPDLLLFDSTRYTNWEKVINGKTSNNTDIHGTLSGGTYNNTFLIAGGFTRSDYNFPGNFADQRLTLHSAFHHISQDNRLTIDFGTDYGYDQNNSPSGGGGSIVLPPNTPDLLDKQGNLVWSYNGVSLDNYQFYGFLKQTNLLQNYNLNTTMRLTYKILTGLSISANLGYNRNTSSEHAINPASAQDPLYPYITATFANNNFETINVEPQLDYTTTIGKGVLTSLAGATYKKNTGFRSNLTGSGYANDNFLGSIDGAPNVSAYDQSTIYKYDAAFARVKYVYDRKYILSLNGNRDGSSNFGPGRQFGNFGSVGAGWIFTEEHFFKKTIPFMSYGKLSGSYGTSGSDGIAAYNYQPFWASLSNSPPFQGAQPDVPQNLYNPNYSWALKKSLNTALDLGMFHDRVLLNATWYHDREGNQLGGYSLPGQTGFAQVLENLPANVQNAGWEFAATSNQIKTQHFSWSTTFNITFNRNKLLSFPGLAGSSYAYQYVLGKPVSEVFGYRYDGINSQTGLFQYLTSKGQVTNNPNYELASLGGDVVPIGDREVKYMGGFGNTFSYKHISLYVFFQFSSQEAPNYMSEVYGSYIPGIAIDNQPVQVLNYWKNPGDHATFQKLTSNYGTTTAQAAENFSSSSGAYSNDTYARLKTVALSYSFPDAYLKKAHIQSARVYINAQNLLTLTNYKVADPETFANYTGVPVQRTIVCGLNFNF
jgi:TonB-dependent starch-binding outer membrane protein SusC